MLSQEVVQHSHGAQEVGDEAGGGPAWADIMEVFSSGHRSLVEGEWHVWQRPVGSEWWPAWRADPQPMTTWRCTGRQQRLPAVVLRTWNRGVQREAEQRESGESGGAEMGAER
jgi:hypothetical protein